MSESSCGGRLDGSAPDVADDPKVVPPDEEASRFPPAGTIAPIHAVQYDERVRILSVDLKDGATYHFLDVPEPVYFGLTGSPSRAAYFRDHVAGRYAFRRMA